MKNTAKLFTICYRFTDQKMCCTTIFFPNFPKPDNNLSWCPREVKLVQRKCTSPSILKACSVCLFNPLVYLLMDKQEFLNLLLALIYTRVIMPDMDPLFEALLWSDLCPHPQFTWSPTVHTTPQVKEDNSWFFLFPPHLSQSIHRKVLSLALKCILNSLISPFH